MLEDWAKEKDACEQARDWLKGRNEEQAWRGCMRGDWMLWALNAINYSDVFTLRLHGIWCALQVADIFPDPRCAKAYDVAEAYLLGDATDEEMNKAGEEVRASYKDAKTPRQFHAAMAASSMTTVNDRLMLHGAWEATWGPSRYAAMACHDTDLFRKEEAGNLRRLIGWPIVFDLWRKDLCISE